MSAHKSPSTESARPAPASTSPAPATLELGTPELVERRDPGSLPRHEFAWRHIAPYEGGLCPRTTVSWNQKGLEHEYAWRNTFAMRLGDIPPGDVYCVAGEWCRRIMPPVLDCYGRALGRAGTTPHHQALVPADPWRTVCTRKAIAYLKAVPIGARFRVTSHDGWYMKTAIDFMRRTIIGRREQDGRELVFPPNVVVELDESEIPV